MLLPIAMLFAAPEAALAHASDRGFVLLAADRPLHHRRGAGGGGKLCSSDFSKTGCAGRLGAARLKLFRLRFDPRFALSLLSFALLAGC
jgi:hypothetical protein